MRSVKGTRRRSRESAAAGTSVAAGGALPALALAALAALAVVSAGCPKEAPPGTAPLGSAPGAEGGGGAGAGGSADVDCREVIRRPLAPHLVEVAPDGKSVTRGPSCPSGTCLAGSRHAFAWRDAAQTIHVTVGERTVDVPVRESSPLHATHTLLGVVLGREVAVVDRGDHTALIMRAHNDDVVVPLPELAGRVMGHARAFDGGVLLLPMSLEDRGPPVALLAMKTAAPATANHAITDENNDLIGWLVTGEHAALVGVDGVRRELGISLPAAADLAKIGPWFVAVQRKKRTLITFDHPPLPFDDHVDLVGPYGDGGAVVGFDARGAGVVVVVRDGKIEPVAALPAPEGHTRVTRVLAAPHQAQFLALQRVQDDACNTRDRAFFVDAGAQPPSITLLADDDKMRMQPTWANDRFRYVEGDAELSAP